MTPLILHYVALQVLLGATTIQGQVVGPDNQPLAHAQVFLEPGLGGELRDTATSPTGTFTFENVAPGATGVFAVAPGFGYEGRHLTVAVGDVIPPFTIVLREAATIEGTIVDHKGEPIKGARVTRIGVKGAHKVGIPLAKLRQYGYSEPVSDEKGRFMLAPVPAGTQVDLKIGHPSFAQEGITDVPAGERNVRVTLYPGVLVEGDVLARAGQAGVGRAAVLIRNAQPPHDTTTTVANLHGHFSVRLKPGVYMYQAQAVGMKSAGWEQLTVTGERPIEQVRVTVAGTGSIHGTVKDAITGRAIENVRVSLMTNNAMAGVARTGPGGDFQFTAGEGENIVRIDSTPGYYPPDSQNVKVTISEGAEIELPGMWLKPLPTYAMQIVDSEGNAVPGALVTVLRPHQFGWHIADASGTVEIRIQEFPADGPILGRAEHPDRAEAALFRLEKDHAPSGMVQLFPTGSVEGEVVNSRGRPIMGASVGAFFPGESAGDAILLWQTYTAENGTYTWKSVVPGVPQRCAARASAGTSGESATFNLTPGEHKPLGKIVVEGGESAATQLGKTLRWYAWDLVCGTLPESDVCASSPVLLVRVNAENAPYYAETLANLRKTVSNPALLVGLLVNSAVPCTDATVPVLTDESPGAARVLLLDRGATVVLETDNLPPVQFLEQL